MENHEKINSISIGSFKSNIKGFCIELKESNFPNKDIKFINKTLSSFSEEFYRKNKNKSNIFDHNVINAYLLKTLPKKFPDYSKNRIVKIHGVFKKYINFLCAQDVLTIRENQNLMRNLYKKSELKKELDGIKNFFFQGEITEIKDKIARIISDYNNFLQDQNKIDKIKAYLKKKDENLLIKAILHLTQSIPNEEDFIALIAFISEFVRLNSFPAKLIEELRSKTKQDLQFNRLLALYSSFISDGYNVKFSLFELVDEINADLESLDDYFEATLLFSNLQDEAKRFLEQPVEKLENYIQKIIPFNKNTPYEDPEKFQFFNLPERVNINIQSHIEFLGSNLHDPFKKMKFIQPLDEFEEYDGFGLTKDPKFIPKLKVLLEKADDAFYEGKYQKALIHVNKLLKIDPSNSTAFFLKSKIYLAKGKYYQALINLLKCIEINPYSIEKYMNLSLILEIGGYFYSSTMLICILLHFTPFDFDLYMQLAVSQSQLINSFKKYLKMAGRLDLIRFIKFLDDFWPEFLFKSKDSLQDLGVTEEEYKKLLKSAENISSAALKVIDSLNNRDSSEYLDPTTQFLSDPLNFFPNKEDHTLKNWFSYELTLTIIDKFNDNFPNLKILFSSKNFIDFCFELSKSMISNILNSRLMRKNMKPFEFSVEDVLNQINDDNVPYYNSIEIFLSKLDISQIFYHTLIYHIIECQDCPKECLNHPYDLSSDFSEFSKRDMNHDKYLEIMDFINGLIIDFTLELEDLDKSPETIHKKTEHAKYFLEFLFTIVELNDFKRIDDNINEECLSKFLKEYCVKIKINTSKTSHRKICRSLKSFIRFLHTMIGYFNDSKYRNLRDYLTNSVFLQTSNN